MSLDTMLHAAEEQVNHLVCEVRIACNLHWNYRHLKAIPEKVVEEGTHIENINLKYNRLTHLPDNFGKLKQLTTCHLSNNNLISLPECLGELTSLQSLDVGNNNLIELPLSLAKLPSLRYLVAVNNKLSSFPPELCTLKSLSLLMLSGNQLAQLPDEIGQLWGLQGLYVDHNNLRELPRTLALLPVLVRITCCSNPLVYLPLLPFQSNPRIFFDNCPDLNYLTVHQVLQHSSHTWDPLHLQACGCFKYIQLQNNTVYIYNGSTAATFSNENCLHIPSQIQTITRGLFKTTVITSLKELCLRYLWKTGQDDKDSRIIVGKNKTDMQNIKPDLLPTTLYEVLRYGPVAECNNIKCLAPLLTFVSIVVVSITVSSRVLDEGQNVPLVLFFCCDFCSKKYIKFLEADDHNFSVWLYDKLRNSCMCVEV